MAKRSVRTDRYAVTALQTNRFAPGNEFRIASPFREPKNRGRALSYTESVLFAFVNINTDQSHCHVLLAFTGLSPRNLML